MPRRSSRARSSGSPLPAAARPGDGGRRAAWGRRAVLAFLAALCAAVAGVSFTIGSYSLSPAELWEALPSQLPGGASEAGSQAATVLFSIRVPRVLLAALVGAALAISGAAYQGIFRNPMVSPDILGVSNAASVGVAVGLLLGLPTAMVHGISFCCGIAAVALVLGIARAVGERSGNATVVMILAGVVVGSLASAVVSLVKYVADPDNVLPAVTYWLMGSFARSGNLSNAAVMAVFAGVGGAVLMHLRWKLNVMTFGDDEARAMGVDVRRTRLAIIVAATLMTSVSVCFCGVVGWVGLIVPHMARLLVGPNYRTLIPVSMLAGAGFMMVVDDVARIAVPGELPIGVLTAVIGAPLFIYLLFKSRNQYL